MNSSLKMTCLRILDKIDSFLNSSKRISELKDKIDSLEKEIEVLKISKLYVLPSESLKSNQEQWCYSCLKNVNQTSSCMSTNCPYSTSVTSGVTM